MRRKALRFSALRGLEMGRNSVRPSRVPMIKAGNNRIKFIVACQFLWGSVTDYHINPYAKRLYSAVHVTGNARAGYSVSTLPLDSWATMD